MHHLQTLHERLCSLRDGGPIVRVAGICQVVRDEASYIKQQMAEALLDAFNTWPEFSRDPIFPVPHADMKASDAFYEIEDVWEGQYGAARRRLLDHCIAAIERQLPAVEGVTP